MSLTPGFKKFIGLIVTVAVVGGGIYGYKAGYFKSKASTESQVIEKMDMPANTSSGPIQSSTVNIAPVTGGFQAKVLTIPWNATLGLQYANGGALTAADSLMAKRGVKLNIERQDDYAQMLAEQVKFAKAVADGNANPSEGAAFVIIMGDGYPGYVAGAQEALGKLGQQIQVVGSLGYSRGEDKCMMPANVKADAQKARGVLIGGVKADGDINICLKWASDNNIPVNADGTTYDPQALNFVYVDSFVKADDNYIAGYCENRPVVDKGKKTGETKRVCQNGTATWTPGDVKVALKKGGLVSVASTKEYMWQMPSIIIGNKAWMEKNPQYVENFLAAAFEGGEAVRSNDAALTKGADIAAAVFKEETGAYWKRYFKGVIEQDLQGQDISLGGSTTNGLGDNAYLFGLNGNDNLYKRVYTVYGNTVSKLYPDILPKLVPYDQVVNPTYIQNLLNKSSSTIAAAKPEFTATQQVTGTFAKKSYSIEFKTGSAEFSSGTVATLNELLDQLSISGLTVQVNGHTDNVGNSESNQVLSKKRAEAVKAWLTNNAPSSFPADRIRARGYGDSQPVGDNNTADGKAKNRRVDILLLTTN
jgi:outer membrane protein OmpA-like peptidoglycan-associated protein